MLRLQNKGNNCDGKKFKAKILKSLNSRQTQEQSSFLAVPVTGIVSNLMTPSRFCGYYLSQTQSKAIKSAKQRSRYMRLFKDKIKP